MEKKEDVNYTEKNAPKNVTDSGEPGISCIRSHECFITLFPGVGEMRENLEVMPNTPLEMVSSSARSNNNLTGLVEKRGKRDSRNRQSPEFSSEGKLSKRTRFLHKVQGKRGVCVCQSRKRDPSYV